jgi:hypothetical protein
MQRDEPVTLIFALEDLSLEAQRLRQEALRTKTPKERDELLRKARQAETAARIDDLFLAGPAAPTLKGQGSGT